MTEPAFGNSTLDRYERKQILGHGAYGKVYYAVDRITQEPLALKKIILDTESEGIPSVALREIMLLREVNCPYIVKLRNVINNENKLYLVFEFVEKDLKRYLEEREGRLSAGEVKRLMFQLVSAVAYLHSRRIIHRDLKPQNILISSSGAVKLADFGLARIFQFPLRPYTQEVVTLWYRPPELLLGAVEYSPAVDIWSLGVIFAEIVTRAPLFPGETEMDQLYRVFRTMGTPSEKVWPGVTHLKKYRPTFPNWPPTPLHVPGLDADGCDLLEKMLRYNPSDRYTAKEALRHPYFADLDQWVGEKREVAVMKPSHWEEAQGKVPGTCKIFLKTFGCSHNISDSEVMLGLLTESGYLPVDDPSVADVWIVNSCTVKNPSQDAFETWVKKSRESQKRLIVAGCVPQADRSLTWLDDVSVVGVTQIDRIVEVVEQTLQGNTVKLLSTKKLPSLLLPKVRRNKLVEIIPISTGCLGRCTFCKTKQARGNLVSYPIADIVKRVEDACGEGVKDIWLTSEDSGAYGRDIKSSLPLLLTELLNVMPKDVMLRVGMTNPPYVLEHISALSEILKHPQVYEFLHVPVQSGSDPVLELMCREYRIGDFCSLIDRLRSLVPHVHICTDIICGFPGETDSDHQETLTLLSRYKFPSVYISQFYPRPGTVAATMTRIPTQVVKSRSREVTKLFESYTCYEYLLGTIQKVYLRDFDDEKANGQMVGHTKDYTKVVLPREENLIGGCVYARITEAKKWHVVAEIVPAPASPAKQWGWLHVLAALALLLAVLWTYAGRY